MSTYPLIQSNFFGKDEINLYSGPFQLTSEQGILKVEGRVYLVFKDKSTIKFEGMVKSGIPFQLFNIWESEISTPTNFIGKAWAEDINYSFSSPIKDSNINGTISELTRGNNEEKFDRCLLYVTNLDYFSTGKPVIHNDGIHYVHLPLTIGDWSIGIQKGFNEEKGAFINLNKENKEFALTHVIEIKNMVNDSVSLKELESIKDLLFWTFAFCIGRKVGFPIIKAFKKDDLLFEQYLATTVERHRNTNNWFPRTHVDLDSLTELIPLFYKAFQDPYLKKALTTSIHWYNEAIQTKYAGQPVIFTQIALETTWWLILSQMAENKNTYKNLRTASEKMKKMADLLKIDDDLDKFPVLNFKKYKVEHFPRLFTKYRNHLSHPQPDALFESFTAMDSYKLGRIGIQYLELSILYILDYNGHFVDYRDDNPRFEFKKVPWA